MIGIKGILEKAIRRIKAFYPLGFVFFLAACEDPCPTVQDYISRGTGGNCALCGIFKILTTAAGKEATSAWNRLAGSLIPVVTVAAAIYIAIYTFKLVSNFGKQNAADFLTSEKKGLFALMFKLAVIIICLSSSFITSQIITPLLSSGIEIGGQLAVRSNGTNFYDSISAGSMSGSSPWNSFFNQINESVKGFNDSTYDNVAIGQALICNATLPDFWSWSWMMLLYGLMLFVFGWILFLGIAFYLADVILRLAIGAVLLPIGIACAISELTTGFTKNIWNIFLNAFFSFVMLGIILGISMQIIDLCLRGEDTSGMGGSISSFLSNYQAHLDANQISELSDDLVGSGKLLFSIICFSIIVKLVEQLGKLADKVSDAAGITNAASQAGAGAAQLAAPTAKKLAGGVGGQAWSATKYAGHVGARITRADKLYKFSTNKLTEARGILTGTGAQGYKAFWRKNTGGG